MPANVKNILLFIVYSAKKTTFALCMRKKHHMQASLTV